MAFQPLRRRVVRVADRLAFGAAAAPYEALADFSRRLGRHVPTRQPCCRPWPTRQHRRSTRSRVVVTLHVEAGPTELASWPPGQERLAAGSRCRGARRRPRGTARHHHRDDAARSPLRPREHAAAGRPGRPGRLAFRNARLTAELSAEVEQLAGDTGELAESRRRLISAGDAERSRLERAIGRQVAPHLAPLPDRLRQLSQPGARRGSRVRRRAHCWRRCSRR